MSDRISSLDSGYSSGDLSLYPTVLDTTDVLYQAKNNATTVATQSITYNSKFIVVEDTTGFPTSGLLKVGEEIVYYGSKTTSTFKELVRGFAQTRRLPWSKGTEVSNTVMAEHHNAIKDAIINIETNLGIDDSPADDSLNKILKDQENRFLAPKPLFRGFPLQGTAPLQVKFQNFSGGSPIRFLWDFGDGATSVETNPTHTYLKVGTYSVQLNIITSLGAQGIVKKTDYITIDENNKSAFFYVTPLVGTVNSTSFTFVDQTDGDIASRYWIFDDGNFEAVTDPDVHTTNHMYTISGIYQPSLIVIFSNDTKKKLTLLDEITVI